MELRNFKQMNVSLRYLSTLLVLSYFIFNCSAVKDDVLFTVSRAPRYLGILQDHRGEPLSVEASEEYMDQDYIATNRKRHKLKWNKNPLDVDDFEDEDTEEDDKDRDVRGGGGNRLPPGPVKVAGTTCPQDRCGICSEDEKIKIRVARIRICIRIYQDKIIIKSKN